MIVQKTEEYEKDCGFNKSFIVIEYCCARIAKDMKENRSWYIEDKEIQCWDYESGFSARYCPHCGKEIIIK